GTEGHRRPETLPGGKRGAPASRAAPRRAHALGRVPPLSRRDRPAGAARAAGPGRAGADRARAGLAADPDRGLSARPRDQHALRASGGPRRGAPGMALPSREDGPAHHRHPAWHRRIGGRGLSHDHAQPAGVPRPVGDPRRARARPVRPRTKAAPRRRKTPRLPAEPPKVARLTATELGRSPNSLAPHYSRFKVADRLLLTGH